MFVEFARSEALRSPKGGAFRAQRRANSTSGRPLPNAGRFSDHAAFLQKNSASGAPRSDDFQLGRLLASPRFRTSPCLIAAHNLHDAPTHGLPCRFLVRPSTSSFSPRVIRRRYPLASHRGKPTTLALAFHRTLWLGRSRNFLPAQPLPAILDGDAPVPPFTDQHLASCRRVTVALRLQLKIAILVAAPPSPG